MKIQKFEDIIAWQRSRELIEKVYRLTNRDKFNRDFSLKDQIRRAAVSVMSNIAEGYARQTDKEFVQFLYIARGSAFETQSQLYVALDLGYISKEEFDKTYETITEISRLIMGFIKYLQNK
ncbi:MAG: 30S ribosomal protein S23 [Candidatus Dadabacteria bacterium CSP1-2]|nr:MAG: 30S ribosomal protein S23 [Candidatus Dadabacteria bacterium CSP1-2]HJZ04421.1 four helix bundle protein [Patescibacteria group bacterium]